jgi:O-acetylserine/cysteine efflux transporter
LAAVDYCHMRQHRSLALFALTTAGLLWGTTVPLTKVALDWLGPGWLTVVRFAIAALLLAVPARRHLRAALTPAVAAWGAIGFGIVLIGQNAGIERTSVSHAALLVGAVPIMVAVLAVASGRSRVGALSWAGFALALGGVVFFAGGGGGSASLAGDGLVVASCVLSAAFVVAQPRLLTGRDPMAVTAVQFAAGALIALPYALLAEGPLTAPPSPAAAGVVAALIVGGTLLPFTLFALGQSRLAPEIAGAFLNLEPLVGALAGFMVFGDPAGPVQLAGALAIVAGIVLSAVPVLPSRRMRVQLRSG